MFSGKQRKDGYPPRLTPIGTPAESRQKRRPSNHTDSTGSQSGEQRVDVRPSHDEELGQREPEPDTQQLCAIGVGSCFCGVPCSLHVSYFLLLGIEMLTAILIHETPPFVLLTFIIYCPVLLVSIGLHELGHGMATVYFRGRVRSVVLWPLGGFTVCGTVERGNLVDEVWIAMAGPLMHIPQVAFWLTVYAFAADGDFREFRKDVDIDILTVAEEVDFLKVVAQQAFIMNAALFCFNLGVPCYPLDCGRCMAAMLVSSGWSIHTTSWIMAVLSVVVGFFLSAWGFWVFIFVRSTGGIFMVVVACFILHYAQQLIVCAQQDTAVGTLNHPLFDQPCYRAIHRATMLRTETALPHGPSTLGGNDPELATRRTSVSVV